MYDTILVNGAVPASLNIERIDLSYKNQATDTAVLTFNNNVADAPAAFAYGAAVTVANGATVIFRGSVKYVEHTGSGSKERVEVTVVNVWDSFENLSYLYRNTYYNLDGTVDDVNASYRVPMGGNITTRIQDILSKWVERGIVAIGQIQLPVITIPENEVRNITIADAIKTTLKWTPGAVVLFDYQTDPPTLYIGTQALLEPYVASGSFEIQDQAISDLKYAKRDDLLLNAVVIHCEREIEFITIYNGTETRTNAYEQVLEEVYPPGADLLDPRTLRKEILLDGTRRRTKTRLVVNPWTGHSLSHWFQWLYVSPTGYGYFYIPGLVRHYNPSLPSAIVNGSSRPSSVQVTIDYVSPACPTVDEQNFLGNPGGWWPIEDYQLPDSQYLTSGTNPLGISVIKVNVTAAWANPAYECTISFYAMYTSTYDRTFYTSADTDIGSAPVGLAKQYYDLRQGISPYDGQLSVLNATMNPGAFRYAKLLLSEETVAEGPVQSLNWSSADDCWRVKFGPPEHLSLQDFMELLKM